MGFLRVVRANIRNTSFVSEASDAAYGEELGVNESTGGPLSA